MLFLSTWKNREIVEESHIKFYVKSLTIAPLIKFTFELISRKFLLTSASFLLSQCNKIVSKFGHVLPTFIYKLFKVRNIRNTLSKSSRKKWKLDYILNEWNSMHEFDLNESMYNTQWQLKIFPTNKYLSISRSIKMCGNFQSEICRT